VGDDRVECGGKREGVGRQRGGEAPGGVRGMKGGVRVVAWWGNRGGKGEGG